MTKISPDHFLHPLPHSALLIELLFTAVRLVFLSERERERESEVSSVDGE